MRTLKRLSRPIMDRAQRQAMAMMTGYFNHPTTVGSELTPLTDRVLTFNWYFDRAVVIRTDDGLVVNDPFHQILTTELRRSLIGSGVDDPVHTVIYSHFHLDHVRGAADLEPGDVIAHRKCVDYWRDFNPETTADILAPTDLVEGDTSLSIGGVDIQLLDVGLSHTDTLLITYLPAEGVVYAPDTVGIGVFLPTGGIALYTPGYLRALERIASLDFELFIGSHFGWGTKQQYIEAMQHQIDIRDWVRQALADHSGRIPPFQDRRRLLAIYDDVHRNIKAKYGDLHGYDTQALYTIVATITAEYVGY